MKKKEMRQVTITYCNYCGKDISSISHKIVELKDGTKLDLCSQSDGSGKTCAEKYRDEEIERTKQNDTD